MHTWILLITSLPTENATARMRAWRSLKASGATVLRDGVYLMPEREACRVTLESVATDVRAADGNFGSLFDRSADFANLLGEISLAREGLHPESANDVLKQARRLRKTFTNLVAIDFFPGEAQKQADEALRDLEQRAAWALSPDEPRPINEAIGRLDLADYRGCIWATRQRPWVDRLASAWLIRRCIDPQAKLLWLMTPSDCPADALGFDFDGANFTHVGARVTFEVLLSSFGLEKPALQRFGALAARSGGDRRRLGRSARHHPQRRPTSCISQQHL